MKTLVTFLFVISFSAGYAQKQAEITMSNGDVIDVLVIEDTNKGYKVQIGDGPIKFIPKSAITDIKYGCTFKENTVDDMTGASMKLTQSKLLLNKFGSHSLSVQARAVDEYKFIEFDLGMIKAFAIESGADVLIKLTSEEVIKLSNNTFVLADNKIQGVASGYNAKIKIQLSKDIFDELTFSDVTKIRFYTSEGYVDCNIKEKNQSYLKDILKCL